MPHNTGQYPPLSFNVPSHQLRENQPPRPWALRDPLPNLVDLTTFIRIHQQRDDQLKCYVESGRPDWQSMPYSVWGNLLRASANCLAACNAEARIAVAEIACTEFDEHEIAKRHPLHFVTFAPAVFVLPIETAGAFDPRQLIAMLRQALESDVSVFGFVEAALYLGWGPDGPAPFKRFVSWHLHFISWGIDRASLMRKLEPLKDRHSNMVGRSPIWVVAIEPEEVEQKLIYMAKGQLKEYRIGWAAGEDYNEATGVITPNTRQQKRWMRQGEHVRMCNVMRDHRIGGLLFGNGRQGSWLANKVRYEARRPFCAWAHAENSTAAYQGRPVPYPEVDHNHALGLRLQREYADCF